MDPENIIWNLDRIQEASSRAGSWVYGLTFPAPPQLIMKTVTEVLGELDTVLILIDAYVIEA